MSGTTGTARPINALMSEFADGQAPRSIFPVAVRDIIASALSFQAGIAAAGTTQGTATALTSRWNVVSTVAAGSGVVLAPGVAMTVSNRGVNPLAVYPPSGAQIEALTVNAAFTLAPGQDLWVSFDPANANQIYAVAMLNLATLATSLPSSAGVPWNNGGVLSIS